jgi:hypothetical protein
VVNLLWPAVQQAPREASGPLRFFLGVATAAQQQHDVAEPLFEQVPLLHFDLPSLAFSCLALP